jgi:hypothetical protein
MDDFSVVIASMCEKAEARREKNLRMFFADLLDYPESSLPENIMSEEFVKWFNEKSLDVYLEYSNGHLFIDGLVC